MDRPIWDRQLNRTRSYRMGRVLVVGILVFSLLPPIGSRLGYAFLARSPVIGEAVWRETNNQSYLFIHAADPFSLGVLTGRHLAAHIVTLKTILMLLGMQFDFTYPQMLRLAEAYLPWIPSAHTVEMEGIARGASSAFGMAISFGDILLQNCWMDLLYGRLHLQANHTVGCTSLAVSLPNSRVEFAQNFDFTCIFRSAAAFVLHQVGENPQIFSLRLGGSLMLPLAKSAVGITLLPTLIQSTVVADYCMPIFCRTRLALDQADSLSTFCGMFFNDSRFSLSFTLTLIHHTLLYSAEIIPGNFILTAETRSVKTNTFTTEGWQGYLLDATFSKDRQALAERLLQGQLSPENPVHLDLRIILQDRPMICRETPSLFGIETMVVFSNTQFGISTFRDSGLGQIPC